MAAAPRGQAVTLASLLEGGGAGLIFIGAFVPWVITVALFATVPVRGVATTYGRILPLIPLLVLALLGWRWYARRGRWVHLAIAALGMLAVTFTFVYMVEVKRNVARAQESLARSTQALPGTVDVRFDAGFYLTLAGGAAMIAGGVLGTSRDHPVPVGG